MQILVSTKMHAVQAFIYYWFLSYTGLALTSAITNLPNMTLIFHGSQRQTIKFHKSEILKFMTFQVFYNPLVDLKSVLNKLGQ